LKTKVLQSNIHVNTLGPQSQTSRAPWPQSEASPTTISQWLVTYHVIPDWNCTYHRISERCFTYCNRDLWVKLHV